MLELVLKGVDRLLNIRPSEAYTPPPLESWLNGKHVSPHEIKELADLYKEANADMRAFRDWEFKIVTLYIQVSAFFFAGNMALLVSNSADIAIARFWIGCVSILFLFVFWLKVHARIAHDNRSYGFNMGHRRYIERIWFGPRYPSPPVHVQRDEPPWWRRLVPAGAESNGAERFKQQTKKGTGPGFRRMQSLVALSAIATIAAIAIGVAWLAPPAYKVFCASNVEPLLQRMVASFPVARR